MQDAAPAAGEALRMAVPAKAVHAVCVLAGSILMAGCHGARPGSVGVGGGRLAACPPSPNCVSSLAADAAHRVEPLRFDGTAAAAVARMTEVVRSLPRSSVVSATETYLHVEFRSAVFGFVDDVEFLVDEAAGLVHIRSASRVGSYDFGVNRRRVERIRSRWGGRDGG